MTTLLQDVRFALRQLPKSPGFTIVAVSTLALGIGANVVVLSVMNGLILRLLNVPQAQSLYGIERASDKDMSQSYPDYLDLRDRNHSFDEVALDTGENPSLIWGVEASGNYFDALRIQPYLGRFFHASDEHGANSAPYIVLSCAYWFIVYHLFDIKHHFLFMRPQEKRLHRVMNGCSRQRSGKGVEGQRLAATGSP